MSYRTATDERGDYLIVPCDGQEFLTDLIDRHFLDGYTWRIMKHVPPYVVATKNGKTILLHRLIMDAPDGVHVDHRDFETLNNRRYQLRLASPNQNYIHVHRDSPRSGRNAASGLRGAYQWPNGQWYSVITIDLKTRYLGKFDTAEDAARAWDAAALAARGEFAVLNFPRENY